MPARIKLLCTLVQPLSYSDRVHFKVLSDDAPDAPTIAGKLTIDVSSTNDNPPLFERDRTYAADIVELD
jgi:hypothetical protein